MAYRSVPNAAIAKEARFNQLKVERFRSDVQAAIGHSLFRNDRVVRTLCYIGMLAGRGSLPKYAIIDCIEASRRHFSSPNGYQAAHYLPGQITINSYLPWSFIQDSVTRLKLECLFAEVEHLPANFNKADSAAENCGLKVAFAKSCKDLIEKVSENPETRLNRKAVKQIYDTVWLPMAELAFQAAITQKETRPHMPTLQKDQWGNILNLAERGNISNQAWGFEQQINILRHYLNTAKTLPPALLDIKMSEFEREFKP